MNCCKSLAIALLRLGQLLVDVSEGRFELG